MKHARGRHNKRNNVRLTLEEKRQLRLQEKEREEAAERAKAAKKEERAKRAEMAKQARMTKKTASKEGSQNQLEKKSNKKQNRELFWRKAWIAVIICACVGFVVALGVGSGMYAAISNEIDELDFEGIAYNFSSIVYADDKDGNSVEVEYLHDDGNREWIDTEKIPQVAKDAAISIEDERFYSHKGVDLKRTTGAVFGWFTSKLTGKSPSYGGSTITQQVIKNITNEKDKTVIRKVKEMMRAVAFEKRFTKEEILSTYLNIIYFGNQCYGIEAAAKMYFSKNAIDLTLPEAAMIVGITQAPTRFDPFKNPENATSKRNTVLTKMYELEKISKEEYDAAVASPLGVNEKRRPLHSSIYSYFIDQVINDVIDDLQEQRGYSQAFASSQVFGGGLKIYTTMDSEIQEAIESVYENKSNFPGASSGVQSAMVIVDPATGEIKGMVGGIGKKTESRGLNRATQSKRQPGSSVKPISVYAPSLENGKITAATIITDSPLTVGTWSPKNSYSGFKGDMSVRRAIEISANIPAVKTLQTLGVDKSFDFMTKKLGFTSLTDNDKNLSALGLGGMTNGVSPKEMAAAYAVFANGGVYLTPHTYTKVLDGSGKVLLEAEVEERRVLSEANAYIMTSFLKDVVNGSAGTGRNARLSGITAYGKTGTSNDNKDKWFCGYTPYYVGAVWYGYDAKRSVGSTNISTQVWKKVMQKIHDGLPERTFEQPESVTAVSVCQLTGKLSSSGCRHGKSEYFARGTLPTKYCNNKHSGVVGATSGNSGAGTEEPLESTKPIESTEPTATDSPIIVPGDPSAPPIVIITAEPITPPISAPTSEPTSAPVTEPTPASTPEPVATPAPSTPAPTAAPVVAQTPVAMQAPVPAPNAAQ